MIQFRLETFNTFNHVQFNGISTGVNVPNAGQAVTAATRRQAGAGDELPRSAPDPGRVEVLFLGADGATEYRARLRLPFNAALVLPRWR